MKNSKSNIKGMLILLVTAMIWGIAFTAQTAGAEHLGAFAYTSIRFFLGVLILIPAIIVLERGANDKVKMRRTLATGSVCGVVMFAATITQQIGIHLGRNSGKAGFLTSLYILIVPIFGMFLKIFPKINTWIGVFCGVIGMYLLTVKESSAMEIGDALIILSAAFWAVHILCIDKFAKEVYPIRFSVIQFTVVAVVSALFMLMFEEVSFDAAMSAWLPLAYGGFGSVGIAFTLQIFGQKYADPVPASLILSLESVFAALAGAILLSERLDVKGYIGCALIFAGIIFAQLPEDLFKLRKNKI